MAIQRWQLAVWVVRVVDGEEPGLKRSHFTDIEGMPWWESHIERLAELDITDGCSSQPARFCPTDTVTRAEMAAFIVRAFNLPDGGPAGFIDTAGEFSADSIDRLYNADVSQGCSDVPLRFCPDRLLTRAEMAALLQRARPVSALPDAGSDFVPPAYIDDLPDIEFSMEPPNTTRFSVPVYICAAPNTFSSADAAREVAVFNSEQSTFFRRASNGASDLSFTSGGVISPRVSSTSSWDNESIAKWANDDGYRGPCYDHLTSMGVSEPFMILADVNTCKDSGECVGGYGWPDAWRALESYVMVPTRSRWVDHTEYAVLVAHEIGHAFYGLCHTFQPNSRICAHQGSDGDVETNCDRTNRCSGDDRLWELAQSVMSYDGLGRARKLSNSYIACAQRRWLGWTDDCATPAPEPPPPADPTLTVRRGGPGVAGSCASNSGCEWVHATGSNWTPDAQFWIRCGDFVDTSRHIPVTYRARYVDSNGDLSWGDGICLSNFSHTVEVWTNSEGPVQVTIAAPAGTTPPPPPATPTLTVTRGGPGIAGSCTANSGCRWIHGSGTGWTPDAQFWIRCGDFVDTSRHIPVTYRARYVDSNGDLSWGDGICLSNFSHTVEVWTNSEGPVQVTIAAPIS